MFAGTIANSRIRTLLLVGLVRVSSLKWESTGIRAAVTTHVDSQCVFKVSTKNQLPATCSSDSSFCFSLLSAGHSDASAVGRAIFSSLCNTRGN